MSLSNNNIMTIIIMATFPLCKIDGSSADVLTQMCSLLNCTITMEEKLFLLWKN